MAPDANFRYPLDRGGLQLPLANDPERPGFLGDEYVSLGQYDNRPWITQPFGDRYSPKLHLGDSGMERAEGGSDDGDGGSY